MQRLLLAFAVMCMLIRPVHAEPPDPEDHEVLMKNRLWHWATVPAWWFAWLTPHEGSHALAAKAYGYDIMAFRPYPHFYTDQYGDRTFFLGAVYMNHCTEGFTITDHESGRTWPCEDHGGTTMIYLAPYLTDVTVFTAADLLLSTGAVDPDSLGGGMLYMGAMVAPWIDFTFNMNTWGVTDRDQITESTGLSTKQVVLMSEVVSAVGIWRLYVNGKRVFYDRPGKSRKDEGLTLSPMALPDTAGISLSGRW